MYEDEFLEMDYEDKNGNLDIWDEEFVDDDPDYFDWQVEIEESDERDFAEFYG